MPFRNFMETERSISWREKLVKLWTQLADMI
jgi:hypothetical protein